jgi:hypothetical protein
MASSPGGKAGNSVTISVEGVDDILRALRAISNEVARKSLTAVMRKVVKPTEKALQANVSGIGKVTGNLARAVTSRVPKTYGNGVQVGVVGFRRSGRSRSKKGAGSVSTGPDRAFHSHLIEFGTRSKKPLTMAGRAMQRSAQGRRDRAELDRVGLGYTLKRDFGILSSGGQRGYFTKPDGKTNFLVTISPRGLKEVAGTPKLAPMARAFMTTKSEARSILERELLKALESAVKKHGKGGS